MENVDLSKFPIMELLVRRMRALENKYWIEGLVLTHMYIETQLRIILEFVEFRKTRNTKQEETVISLIEKTYKKEIIETDLYEKLRSFNTARNNAVHNLGIGLISYDDLELLASESSILINELMLIEVAINARKNYPT
jgi:hypothetical protein